jgi:HK97 family phage prohead protease
MSPSATAAPPRRERRIIRGGAELRTAGGGPPKIAMRIPFLSKSEDMGFVEQIDPRAFDASLRDPASDVIALWNHDVAWVLGRQSNRTLAISVKPDALEAEVSLDPQNTMHMTYFAPAIARRDVIGSSFGFQTLRDQWADQPDGSVLRTLLEVRILELGPVTFPAYLESEAESRTLREIAEARASRRSVAERVRELRRHQVDRRMRELGLDRVEARRRVLDARSRRLDEDMRAQHARNQLDLMLLQFGLL